MDKIKFHGFHLIKEINLQIMKSTKISTIINSHIHLTSPIINKYHVPLISPIINESLENHIQITSLVPKVDYIPLSNLHNFLNFS